MNLGFINKYSFLKTWFYDRIGYLADGVYMAFDQDKIIPCTKPKKIMVISKRYYQESWQTFPAVSAQELKNILRLQSNAERIFSDIVQINKNEEQDGFDVKTIRFFLEEELLSSDTILIPETELIASSLKLNQVCQLSTPSGVLCIASSKNKVQSVYARGMFNNLTTFKLTIGLPEETPEVSYDEVEFINLVKYSLSNCPFNKIKDIVSVNYRKIVKWQDFHMLYWAPTITAIVFLSISNGYFLFKKYQIEQQLSEYGSSVDELLLMKEQLDSRSQFIASVNQELISMKPVHSDWELIYKAEKDGAYVQQFRRRDGKLMLRGRAKDASKVLKGLNELVSVKSAVFDGPVRKSRGEDTFIIRIELEAS